MKVEQKGHTVTIKDTQGDLVSFLMKVTHEYKTFEKHNMIIDLSMHKDLTVKAINSFLPLSKTHRKAYYRECILSKQFKISSSFSITKVTEMKN